MICMSRVYRWLHLLTLRNWMKQFLKNVPKASCLKVIRLIIFTCLYLHNESILHKKMSHWKDDDRWVSQVISEPNYDVWRSRVRSPVETDICMNNKNGCSRVLHVYEYLIHIILVLLYLYEYLRLSVSYWP